MMLQQCKTSKCVGTTTMDHISQLPTDILCYVISKLSLRDAVRTRTLSHRWKCLSSSQSGLIFDKGTQNIMSFKFSFCLGDNHSDDIDRWISFAILMAVENLFVGLICLGRQCYKNPNGMHSIENVGKYVFRSELFESVENKLKHRRLVGCSLGLNFSTNQFASLQTLCLIYIPIVQFTWHVFLFGEA
ncbi:uncharacterized protein LOC110671687 isoform X2 [Hevea brasiliensis]|uniref:uncharacterized protein LOC110671687 isoform X2 n=1 Tax=Hevea brasiliensis TaxID=3981 RepID=UPI0025CC5ED7|nr:uncharacterized protein LOC110671687 isoform X2 [Hevea brasiliensis]